MKLEFYNKENVKAPKKRTSPPTIRFDRINGTISITGSAAKIIGLIPGGMVQIAQDVENPKNWYLSRGETGFVFNKKDLGQYLTTNNCEMARKVLDSVGFEGRSAVMLIGENVYFDEQELWAIITSSATK